MARSTVPVLILALVVLASFGVSLTGQFVWDDRPLIVENRLIKDPGSILTLLTSSFWQTGDRYDRFRSFFRPLVSLSYAADYGVWGLRPMGYRVTNLLLHLLCCWLVYRIAVHEGAGRWTALAAGALFAAHPVHVESVAWISGRTDLLCAAFFLSCFLAHRRAGDGPPFGKWRLFSIALFAAALFSKEMAATLPLLIAADRWLADGAKRRRLRAALSAALPYFATLAIYLVVRHAALGTEAAPLYRLSLPSHVATAAFVLARYTTLLLVPAGLDAHYPYKPIETLASPLALLGLTMLAILVVAATRAARGGPKTCFWIAWVYVALLPVLIFGTFGDVLMADRFLYVPSVGLSMLLVRGIAVASAFRPQASRVFAVGSMAVVMAFAGISAMRSLVWKNDLTLFSGMVETSPDSGMVHSNLGLAYYHRGDYAGAKKEFLEAIRLVPSYALAYNNLAAGFEREGNLSEALRYYRQAMRLGPQQLESRINAASLNMRLGHPKEGLEDLRRLVDKYPRLTTALYAYASGLYQVGRKQEAMVYLERARRVDPMYPHTHYMLGKLLYESGEEREAAVEMRRFLDLWTEEGLYAEVARRVIAQAEKAPRSPSRAP